jgi:hypothetical protein
VFPHYGGHLASFPEEMKCEIGGFFWYSEFNHCEESRIGPLRDVESGGPGSVWGRWWPSHMLHSERTLSCCK